MLRLMLSSNSRICCHGELFPDSPNLRDLRGLNREQKSNVHDYLSDFRKRDDVKFLEEIALYPGNFAAVGVKIKYSELALSEMASVLAWIKKNRDVRIIHLMRRNRLRRFLSHRMALHSGVMVALSEQDRPILVKLTLPFEECIRDFAEVERQELRFKQEFAGNPTVEVFYEDIVDANSGAVAGVQRFLGVEPQPLTSPIVKMGEALLENAIENFAELRSQARSTAYERYFD
jgi:hypothetical protein